MLLRALAVLSRGMQSVGPARRTATTGELTKDGKAWAGNARVSQGVECLPSQMLQASRVAVRRIVPHLNAREQCP